MSPDDLDFEESPEDDAIEPRLVHMTWPPALRGVGGFLLVLFMGLVPSVLMTPGLISAVWLTIAGTNTTGHIVEVWDTRDPADNTNRTGRYATVAARIEFQDGSGRHDLEWLGRFRTPGFNRWRAPVVGDSIGVRYLEGDPSSAKVRRFGHIWLPHGLLWPMCMTFVLIGGGFAMGHLRARRRGMELELRNQSVDVSDIRVEKDSSYMDGLHFRYVAEFEVDGPFPLQNPNQEATPQARIDRTRSVLLRRPLRELACGRVHIAMSRRSHTRPGLTSRLPDDRQPTLLTPFSGCRSSAS